MKFNALTPVRKTLFLYILIAFAPYLTADMSLSTVTGISTYITQQVTLSPDLSIGMSGTTYKFPSEALSFFLEGDGEAGYYGADGIYYGEILISGDTTLRLGPVNTRLNMQGYISIDTSDEPLYYEFGPEVYVSLGSVRLMGSTSHRFSICSEGNSPVTYEGKVWITASAGQKVVLSPFFSCAVPFIAPGTSYFIEGVDIKFLLGPPVLVLGTFEHSWSPTDMFGVPQELTFSGSIVWSPRTNVRLIAELLGSLDIDASTRSLGAATIKPGMHAEVSISRTSFLAFHTSAYVPLHDTVPKLPRLSVSIECTFLAH